MVPRIVAVIASLVKPGRRLVKQRLVEVLKASTTSLILKKKRETGISRTREKALGALIK